jgi:hypothetical protein
MADSYTIDPSEFTPATDGGTVAPAAKSAKAPIKINPKDFKPATSGLEGPTELHSGVGTGEHVAEEAARLAAFGAGSYLGGPAGGGVGGSAADLGIALLHHFLHGTPINISPTNVSNDVMANEVGSYLGEGAGQILGPVVKGAGRALLDKPAIDEAAQKAIESTTAENLANKATLQSDAAKEAAAQKTAAAKAAEKTGLSNLKTRADVAQSITNENLTAQGKLGTSNLAERADVAEAVPEVKAKMDATVKAAEQNAVESTAALANKEANKLLPEAKTAAIQSVAGKTNPATLEQGPQRIERNEQFRESVKGPLQQWRADWGNRRNTLLAPHMDVEVDTAPLRDSVGQQAAQWQTAGRAPFSPRVQKLLDSVADMGPQSANQFPDDTGYMNGVLGDIKEPERRASAENSLIRLGQQPPEPSEPPPTVRSMLAKQAEANSIAQASKGADRTMAQSVSRGIDDTLSNVAPTPELKALNAEYRDHRENFPMAFEDKIGNVARPVDASPEIFNHPQRALDLVKLGTPETKQQLLQNYAEWVTENGPGVIDKTHATFLSKLAPGTPYANPDAWVFQNKAEEHLANVIDSSPAVRAKFDAAMAKGTETVKRDYATSYVKDAFNAVKSLGPIGDRVALQMRAAKTPEEAANIASKFFETVTPEQAASEQAALQQNPSSIAFKQSGGILPSESGVAAKRIATEQQTPGQAAFQSSITSPRNARNALQTFQPKSTEDAAIKAIQGGYSPTSMWSRMKRRAEIWGMITIGMEATMGRTSGYAGAGLGAAGLVGARELMVKAFRNSLTDPAAARAYYRAMLSPGAPGAFDVIAGQIAKSSLSDITSQGVKGATGVSLEGEKPPEQTPPKVGPGVKSLDTSRAETIAPTASATKRAKEVIADLGKGKNPDVHQDLQRGRLSLDETNKILKHGAKSNASALLDHVDLSDAVDAAEVANPEERKMLIPLVEAKMRQSFQGGKFNKTLAAPLARRLQTLKAQA